MTVLELEDLRRVLKPDAPPLGPGDDGRHAAVAAVVRSGPRGAEVLLIRRAEHERDPWSGHMALPGGRFDADDAHLLATALRETREEVGLDLASSARLLGPLDPVKPLGRGRPIDLTIAPFVFELTGPADLEPNHEVVEALWAPLADFGSEAARTTVTIDYEGQKLELPAWDVDGRVVWGLTYRMLEELIERVRALR